MVVVIEVIGGVAHLVQKSKGVVVKIKDFDNAEGRKTHSTETWNKNDEVKEE